MNWRAETGFCAPSPGNALLRRLVRIGVLDEGKMKLDYILGLKIEDFLERRLQTQVFKLGLAKSIHHARVLIRQRHIRYCLGAPGASPTLPLEGTPSLSPLPTPVFCAALGGGEGVSSP